MFLIFNIESIVYTLLVHYSGGNRKYRTKNNCVTNSCAGGIGCSECVVPCIILVDVVNGQWWNINADRWIFPLISTCVYFLSIFWPINVVNNRKVVDQGDFANQFYWMRLETCLMSGCYSRNTYNSTCLYEAHM